MKITPPKNIGRLTALILLMGATQAINAQDILVKEDGTSIKAWQVDMGGSKIYYRSAAGDNAPLQSIDKASVLMWKKADGTRVMIDQNGNDVAPQQQALPQAAAPAAPAKSVAPKEAVDQVANEQTITKINAVDASYVGKPGKKPGKAVIAILNVDPNSTAADQNVELKFDRSGDAYVIGGEGITVTARNKTDRTIYIHLGNTFFLRNGVAVPYSLSSQSQQVPNAKQQQPTAQSFSQSVVAVPAQSSYKLGIQKLVVEDAKGIFGPSFAGHQLYSWTYRGESDRYHLEWECDASDLLIEGTEKRYTPETSPLNFGFNLTYSFSEDNSQPYKINSRLYVAKAIGVDSYYWTANSTSKLKKLIPGLDNVLSLYITQPGKKSKTAQAAETKAKLKAGIITKK